MNYETVIGIEIHCELKTKTNTQLKQLNSVKKQIFINFDLQK